jgi:hypothetical protein
MLVMGCLAVVRMNPLGLLVDPRNPANLVVAGALIVGAAAVAARRPAAFVMGLVAAALTALAGVLGAAKVPGCRMPGYPLMWGIIGLYIAFRLTLVQKNERAQDSAKRPRQHKEGEPATPSSGEHP